MAVGEITAVKKGDSVQVEYRGTFENGEEFDSSERHGQPLTFTAGEGMVVPGFDEAVLDMEVGQEKEITLSVEDGYGARDENLKRTFPRAQLPQNEQIEEGMVLVMQTPQGVKIPATVAKVTPSEVTIDLNHPLAGKVLKFHIKLVGIN